MRAAAASCPLDRLLVETDAPYLAPVPHRGPSEPAAWVVDVGVALAAAVGRPVDEIAEVTRRNATRGLRTPPLTCADPTGGADRCRAGSG